MPEPQSATRRETAAFLQRVLDRERIGQRGAAGSLRELDARSLDREGRPFADGSVGGLAVALGAPDPSLATAGRDAKIQAVAVVDPAMALGMRLERFDICFGERHSATPI
jgi:hypothetical protein